MSIRGRPVGGRRREIARWGLEDEEWMRITIHRDDGDAGKDAWDDGVSEVCHIYNGVIVDRVHSTHTSSEGAG